MVDYLTSKGVSVSRIQSEGYGETRPVAPNNSESNRAKNRRIEFQVKKTSRVGTVGLERRRDRPLTSPRRGGVDLLHGRA